MLVCAAIVLPVGGAGAQSGPDPAKVGSFSQPFTEPTISDFAGYPRTKTDKDCIERPPGRHGGRASPALTHGFIDCKPAAGGLTMLPNGKNMYWDNLAGTENVEAVDPVRVRRRRPQRPDPPAGRRTTRPGPSRPRSTPGPPRRPTSTRSSPVSCSKTTEKENDGSLFCADNNFLPDGRVLATGGTKYGPRCPGNDAPAADRAPGRRNTRVYNPLTNTWQQTPR